MTKTNALAVVTDLDRYMAQIRQYPVLSPEEEIELARRWRDNGDVDAAHTLVTSNLRFVVKIAHEYKGYGAKILDLVQEGSIGLMQAVKRFDPEKGYRLISYSVFWIRSYIHNFLMATTRMIKIGTSRAHRKLFFKLRAFKGMLGASGTTNRDDVVDAAAEKFNVSKEDIIEMERHLSGADASLDAPSAQTGTALAEIIPAEQMSQEEIISQLEQESDRGARLNLAIENLNDRERLIITQRHLVESPVQLQELGEQLGVSKQRVAQIEKRALSKLKEQLADLVDPV